MKYLYITDCPEIAKYVDQCGVDRIFIDLELLGKVERQGDRDTVISHHRVESISSVKEAVRQAEVLVRVNPLNPKSADEIEQVLDQGADALMLPMFRSVEEVEWFCNRVDSRAQVVPLVETLGAMQQLELIVQLPGVSQVHIGLNDLHLELELGFMFELMSNGMVEEMSAICREAEIPFGIGGISTIDTGLVSGRLVLSEHARLGSEWVILSRSFHQLAYSLQELQEKIDLPLELEKVNQHFAALLKRSKFEIEQDKQTLYHAINQVARNDLSERNAS
ncbi:HpcH/HpaI aldolase/citrate lyase family protein [Gimesia panareensis]|uniref:HpcH/HpaI aldolase/citrate lyase family protein n=1 Tax=Gimesia panareensis TaxID=2527978 RepID=A0A518FM22_9PLAN|nr:aldolase/citrate lyase family protein [Gimesia panareensis]QDT27792.1 HpcH/HpaI aldolase/citrate lyase family protein [Gimesia panareensis]QDV17393.1 HpcH/HpaI aldolase/citrate lyase family protein [Gimesia panareensis]